MVSERPFNTFHLLPLPHFAPPIRDFLNICLKNRSPNRPPRSSDLTPLDYFLCSSLKSKVYINRPQNLQDSKNRIRLGINNITQIFIGLNERILVKKLL